MSPFDDSALKANLDELHHKEEERLIQALAPKYGYPYVNLFETTVDIEALRILTEEDSRAAEVAIFAHGNGTVSIAVRNPTHPSIELVFEKLKKMSLTPTVYLASSASIVHAWERYGDVLKMTAQVKGVLDLDPVLVKQYMAEIHTHLDVASHISKLQTEHSPTQTSNIIGVLFGGALALRASDIHIEPEASDVRVRYRLDGVLWDICDINSILYRKIISRLKLLSGLKLNVRAEAQDGRFTFDIGTREVEVRSSVIPGAYGESVVMRLLDPNSSHFKIENLGLNARLREVVEEELARPNGAIITTGPTGSGKTTALYSFLLAIHTPDKKILTLEDPIEYKLPGIVQTQVHKTYSFADGLRAMLRQDPDVILIGEIRDREVAETAIHAAQTGHLVFSTLHTNSAAGAIARLVDIGIDQKMIANSLNLILGQRLVRVLCETCKSEREITTEEQKLIQRILGQATAIHTMFEAKGCDVCNQSGYHGRMGIYEAIRIDKKVEEAIISDIRERVIRESAEHQHIPSMQQDGIMKILAGITTLDEVSRVLDLYHTDE